MLDTLPERLTLARQQHLSHAAFLELVLADEVTRRDTSSAAPRPRRRPRPGHAAGHLGRDRRRALRPAPCGPTDHPAVPRRRPRRPDPRAGRGRQDPPGHRARAHRGPPPHPHPDAARRRNVQAAQGIPARQQPRSRDAPPGPVRLLIIDDFALQPLDATATADFYELVVERHHKASTIVTSNRDPRRMAGHHDRPAARPIRRRPAHLHRPRTRHRRTSPTGAARSPQLTADPDNARSSPLSQTGGPYPVATGGPITVANDNRDHQTMPLTPHTRGRGHRPGTRPTATSTHRHRRARVHPTTRRWPHPAEEPKHRPTKHIEAPDLAGTVRTPREHHAPQLAHPHRAANTRPRARLRPRTRPQYCLARANGRAMLSAATTRGRSGNVLPLRGTPLRGCTTPIRNQRCRSLRRSVPASRR